MKRRDQAVHPYVKTSMDTTSIKKYRAQCYFIATRCDLNTTVKQRINKDKNNPNYYKKLPLFFPLSRGFKPNDKTEKSTTVNCQKNGKGNDDKNEPLPAAVVSVPPAEKQRRY
ncbi:hypothetical protein M9H77_20922 [Catharanthus roseus]|uniref:Uncharacterized protein n=1 Tax=Catharanthus roseus TaxID=4058 RepID=A0ACC0ALA7_CATRO|nr:hypothetical protein M9H77_20922 [Catharanthus roseus]